jgi:hypothetical protein
MKAIVILEDNTTKIVLKPENEFERDIVEKLDKIDNKKKVEFDSYVKTFYGQTSEHKITITITDKYL